MKLCSICRRSQTPYKRAAFCSDCWNRLGKRNQEDVRRAPYRREDKEYVGVVRRIISQMSQAAA